MPNSPTTDAPDHIAIGLDATWNLKILSVAWNVSHILQRILWETDLENPNPLAVLVQNYLDEQRESASIWLVEDEKGTTDTSEGDDSVTQYPPPKITYRQIIDDLIIPLQNLKISPETWFRLLLIQHMWDESQSYGIPIIDFAWLIGEGRSTHAFINDMTQTGYVDTQIIPWQRKEKKVVLTDKGFRIIQGIGEDIRQICITNRAAIIRLMSIARRHKLSLKNIFALWMVKKDPQISMGNFAHKIGMSNASASGFVKNLGKKRLLIQRSHWTYRLLTITEKGVDIFDECRAIFGMSDWE